MNQNNSCSAASEKDKKSFILYQSYGRQFEMLSDVEAGALIKAIFAFLEEKPAPTLSPLAELLYSVITVQLAENILKYKKVCEKNRQNIKKRWKKDSPEDRADAPVIPNDTTRKCGIPNDNDNDIDNDSDNDNENENDSDNVVEAVNEVGGGQTDRGEQTKTYGSFVRLTEKQRYALISDYGCDIVDEYISRVDRYLSENRKAPYANHNYTIRRWLEKDGVPKRQSGGSSFDAELLLDYARNHTPKCRGAKKEGQTSLPADK